MNTDNEIDTLLELNGIIIEQAGGYWTKFEAFKIAKITEERPHGIRYSLTLHNKSGHRLMGFDNAHAVKTKPKGKHKGRKTYDHWHRHEKDEGVPYEFVNAYQLINDFWLEVDNVLKKLGVE